MGAEFIGLDVVPDLVEVDVGPSVVSYELVRSPIELNLTSILTTLLTPTGRRSNRATATDSEQPSRPVANHTRRQVDETHGEPRWTASEPIEHGGHQQSSRLYHDHERLPAADRRRHPANPSVHASGADPDLDHSSTAATDDYSRREERGHDDVTWNGGCDTRGWESEIAQIPNEPEDLGVVAPPTIDQGVPHVSHEWSPAQWDTDPFGLTDVDSGFDAVDESVAEPLEAVGLGRTNTDWEPGIVDEEPVSDLEIGTEGLGFEEFAECAEAMGGLPGLDVEPVSNPLFPDTERDFTEEHTMDDWPTF
jgi:hypothetical protein